MFRNRSYSSGLVDAHGFYNSSMFDASVAVSGFGGWGNPNNDYQISDGAFSTDFILTYPSPHKIRRKYTPQPWIGFNSLFDDGSIFPYNTSQLAADLFTKESQDAMVAGFVGDYLAFEKQFAGVTVSIFLANLGFVVDPFGRAPTALFIG
jgi:tyrosinase